MGSLSAFFGGDLGTFHQRAPQSQPQPGGGGVRGSKGVAVLLAVLILLPGQGRLLAQTAPGDSEVARGVRQVEEGEYDAAILTLDAAARRLAPGSPGPDLAQAFLYLGIAYLAKGHETSARARFREALGQVKDLKLSPDRFAPRVVEVFEKAREEASAARPAPAATKNGGKGKGLLIVGGLGAAAAGVAVAAGGGGSSTGASSASPTSPAAAPATNVFSGPLGTASESASIPLGPYAAGSCRAELSWTDARTEVRMFVNDASSSAGVAETRRVATSSSTAEWTCAAGTRYRVDLFLQEPRLNVNYELKVAHP
jgi:hypothetical protein